MNNIGKLGEKLVYLKMYGGELVEGFGDINKHLIFLQGESGKTASAIGTLGQGIKVFTSSLATSITEGKKFSEVLKNNLGGSAAAASAMMTAATAGIALAVGVAVTAYSAYIQAQEQARQKAEESARTTNEQIKSLNSLKSQYDEIINSTKDETEKNKDLDVWKKTLVETYGLEKQAILGVNLEREKSLDLLDKEILAAKKRAVEQGIADMGDQYDRAKAAFESPKAVSSGLGIDYSEITGVSQDMIDKLKEYNLEISKADTLQGTLAYSYKLNAEELEQQKESLAGAYTALKEKQVKTEAEITLMSFLKSEYDVVSKTYENWITTYSEGTKLIAQKTVIDAFESGKVAAVDSQEAYNELADELVALAGSSETLKQAIIDELAAQFPQFSSAAQDASDNLNNLNSNTEATTSDLKKLSESLLKTISDINTLAEAQKTLAKNGGIDSSSLQTLIEKFPQAIQYANDFAGMQGFIADKMVEMEGMALAVYGNMILADTSMINAMLDNHSGLANALITYYGADHENFIKLANAKYQTDASVVQKLSELWAKYANRSAISIQGQIDAMEKARMMGGLSAEGEEVLGELRLYQEMFRSMEVDFKSFEATAVPAFNSVGQKAAKSAKESKDAWKEAFDEWYKRLKHQLAMNEITEQEYYDQLEVQYKKYFLDKTKYLDEYEKYEEEVYKGRAKLQKELFDKELADLEYLFAIGKKSHAQYLDELYELNEKFNKSNSDLWRKYDVQLYNERQKLLENYAKKIENTLKKDLEDSNKSYDAKIIREKAYREEQTKYYDNLIKIEQDKLSLLNKQYEEEDKLLKIEKARQELAKLQSQRTSLIYRESIGFQYENDAEAVSQAQQNLTDLLKDWQQYQEKLAIENEIERLRKAKDNAIAIIDESISRLEKSKEQAAENINAQIEKLTELKEKWGESLDISEYVGGYVDLLDQILGEEDESYTNRINELIAFVNEWNKQVSRMKEPRSSSSGSSGSSKTIDVVNPTTYYKGAYYSSAYSYADGGVITHTGGAVVHGSDPKPELVLNSDGIENVGAALGITGSTKSVAQQLDKANSGEISKYKLLADFVSDIAPLATLADTNGSIYSNPIIANKIDQLSMRSIPDYNKYERVNANNNSIEKPVSLSINKIEMHGVNDVNTFEKEIETGLSNSMLQVRFNNKWR